MASEIPVPSTMAWSWVIEALSRSKQADTSLLIDIIKKAPEVSDDELGKNCREVVSLRILESLIVKGNQNKDKDAATVGQKLELDPSNNCEDVLRQISEMSAMDLTAVAPEMLNGDVQSFIVHKRASLPKPALQKLKDAILEGSHSILSSLKERSGLTVTTQCNDDIPVNGGNSNVLAQRLEDCSINNKVTLPYGNAASPTHTHDNMDDESQENLPDTNLLPAKRKTAAMRSEIVEIQTDGDQTTLDDCCTSHVQATKKFKQKANFTEDTVVQNAIAPTTHGPSTTLSEGVVRYIEKEGCNSKKEVQCGSSTPQNVDDDLEGNFPESNSLPAKRNRTAIAAENSEGKTLKDQIPLGDGCDIHGEVVKKFKQDGNSMMDDIDEDTVASPVHGLMKFSSEGSVKHIEKEGCNLETEVQVGGVESNGSPHGDDDQHYQLKRIAQSSHAFHQDHLVCDLQVPHDDAKVAELHAELDGQNNSVDETDGHDQRFELQTENATSLAMGVMEKNNSPENPVQNFEGNFQLSFGGSGSKDDMQHNPDFDMTSDSDDYRDEKMDIALKKDALLSSQCTYSQDSFATQAKYCVKCNKEGQLLVCSSDTCQLAVHSSCLPSAAHFDGKGKFYCPFCAYSRAISEYMQVKRKASFARKDLASFIGVQTVCQQKKATMKLGRESRNELRKNEGNNSEDFVNKVSDSHCGVKMGNKHQSEPPLSCSSDHSHSGEKVVSPSDRMPNTLVSGNLERKYMEPQCQLLGVQVEQPVVAHPVHGSDVDRKKAHMADRNEGNAGAEGKKVSEIPESALPQEPVCGPISESSEEDNEKSVRSYSIRLRRPIKNYTYPAIPQLRRKILPWTKAEEEKLKEGVQRLSSPHDRSIPWKQILEFGGDVFQRGRTTIDLKDKWRNICKGGPR
ncbi:uncharacterized protein [Coffea arabica]|uniref:Uncharacterized protein LOC113691459 isoform X2 n=2 Tax=Coffea arabica TaxID=13443 RepID=A0A6P6SGY8_COFAR|nr:uncharacterized protein LOC113691459 isoform X2 [Coffea arabica]XP_027065400.1 uncharacterized protein LOC113691459 isoform X2 [Coffea arabica]